MFFRVIMLAALVLGGLWYLGGEKQVPERKVVSGTVASPHETVKKIILTQESVEKRIGTVKIPTKMLKNGEVQKLSGEQKRNYAVLAAFFRQNPIMLKVAACESSLRHFDWNGQVVIGGVTPDVGVFQINPVHEHELRTYRLDPRDFSHNVAFAHYLYQRDGLRPWNSSRNCWETIKFG